jgi:hypothetical protein
MTQESWLLEVITKQRVHEDIADWKGFECAVVIYSLWRVAEVM